MAKNSQAPQHATGSSVAAALQKFDQLATREKTLIFVSIPALIVFVMSLLVLEPIYKDVKRTQAKTASQQSQLAMLNETADALLLEVQKDPDAFSKSQIAHLNQQLAHVDALFERELGQLVSPKAMPSLLAHLFERADGLDLVKMESIAPTPVFVDEGQSESAQLYRQGIRITFQGGYFDTRDFFADAEKLHWQLYWKYLHYDVDTHPLASTQLEVFTLSTSEAFIGVH